LGQHFLVEPRVAQRIVEIAGVGPGDRVVEVGAGLGSLTVALARAGATVVAVELDRRMVAPLEEVVGPYGDAVRVVVADAVRAAWSALLEDVGPWTMVANLPYNVATPVVLRALDEEPRIERMLVMVQREVGERLAAKPGDEQFGAVSLHVSYHGRARVVRRVPRTVFWPRPNVESVLVSFERTAPPDVDREALLRLIRESFRQRRKTMRAALQRAGLDRGGAEALLERVGIAPNARPEELSLESFVRITTEIAE
jgi:16S rRNA (adenine1518-N6/adenine1519-N6)-dimethyltransferase